MYIDQAEFVVFDVETTGLFPQSGDRIIELAAVKIQQGTIKESIEFLINPERSIPAEAQGIHQITEDMIKGAPTAELVLPQVLDFIGGACLVGHNVKFDLEFLCYQLSLIGRKLKDETPALDTIKMAKDLFPHLKSYRLSSLATALGIQIKEMHRALADVKLTAAILAKLIALAKQKQIHSFKDLHRNYSVPKPNFKIEQVVEEFLF